jgi:hypothetical protein
MLLAIGRAARKRHTVEQAACTVSQLSQLVVGRAWSRSAQGSISWFELSMSSLLFAWAQVSWKCFQEMREHKWGFIMDQESSAGTSRRPVSDDVEESEEHEQPRPAQDTAFRFLNFSNFNDTKAKETQSRVRSHVMHGVHQKKKSGKQSRPSGSIDLDTSALLPPKSQAAQPHPESAESDLALAGPDRMGAGRNDPFQQYPIQMNQRTLELYDHCESFLRLPANTFCWLPRSERRFLPNV